MISSRPRDVGVHFDEVRASSQSRIKIDPEKVRFRRKSKFPPEIQ